MEGLGIPTQKLYVKKTGLPFYDAARLIGVAHLLFGTASAEVSDKGAYWELKGPKTLRDKEQRLWIIDNLPVRSDAKLRRNINSFVEKQFRETEGYFSSCFREWKTKLPPLKEIETALLSGTRGFDPLSDYEFLQSNAPAKTAFKDNAPEVIASSFGLSYSARSSFRKQNHKEFMYILPVFSERFTLGAFLDFRKYFRHNAGGFVNAVWTAISMLTDLDPSKLPVIDFTYNKVVDKTFYESGYLGFERLCSSWRQDNRNRRMILREIKTYFNKTKNEKEGQKVELARTLAQWSVNPHVDKLELIERLKARLLKSLTDDGGKEKNFAYWLRDNLFGRKEIIKEVEKMTSENAVEIPEKLVEAVAKALIPRLDEAKGWFNKFVKLENLNTADRFFAEVERIVSRATYGSDEGFKKIYWAGNEECKKLREIISLRDERRFREFKATFLLCVLANLGRGSGINAPSGEIAILETEEKNIKTE